MKNQEYRNGHFTGERALFRLDDSLVENSLFDEGESPLKEGRNLTVRNVTFGYKYPLWYGKGHTVKNCIFHVMSRSGIWYTDDSSFENCDIEAPKEFRRCKNISLKNINFHDAQETLWTCQGVKLENVKAKGDYFGMNSTDVEAENFDLLGNYPFDGGKNIHVKNSRLISKDAFWNCENVTLENCVIEGEYFGWNSKNITLINCTITSHQGFCYMKGLKLVNCKILPTSDLIFEYCENVSIDVPTSDSETVKNPISGEIHAHSIKEMIRDDERIDRSKIHIFVKEGKNEHEI